MHLHGREAELETNGNDRSKGRLRSTVECVFAQGFRWDGVQRPGVYADAGSVLEHCPGSG